MRGKRSWITASAFAILSVVAAILTGGCSRGGKADTPKAASAAGAAAAVRITAAGAEARDVQRTVELVGTLRAPDEVTVSNEWPGTVEKVLVDLGDRVRPGQLLVRMDPREARYAEEQAEAALAAARKALSRARATLAAGEADVARARAVLEDARVNRRRFVELFADGAVAASQRDAAVTQADVAAASLRAAEAQAESTAEAVAQAEAAVAQAEAGLAIARKRALDMGVRAPMAGAVQRRLVSAGEAVREKTALLILVTTHPLKLAGDVPEQFAAEVRAGQPVRVKSDVAPGRSFPGRLVRVAPGVNPETRTFAIEAEVPNPEGALKPGAFARAEVLTRREPGVVFVPEEAVVSLAGITKVFVVEGDRVAERNVRLGGRDDGIVEVPEGLRAGERVATSALAQLAHGTRVSIAEAPAAASAPSPAAR